MDPRGRYEEIADDLAAQNDDVTLGRMMGMPAIKRAGKMIGGFSRDQGAMVFKLPEEAARTAALQLEGAHLFDPSGGKRAAPMKDWVVAPAAHADRWPDLAETALAG
jgi:hypothetical protein